MKQTLPPSFNRAGDREIFLHLQGVERGLRALAERAMSPASRAALNAAATIIAKVAEAFQKAAG